MKCGITDNEVTLIDLGSGRLKCPDCTLVMYQCLGCDNPTADNEPMCPVCVADELERAR